MSVNEKNIKPYFIHINYFTVRINDLQNYRTSLSVLNFADDTLLYKTFKKTHTYMIVKVLIQNLKR